MKSKLSILITILFAVVGSTQTNAHGPTPQKANEEITIAAKPDQVWAVIKKFAEISSWHTGLAKSAGEGGEVAGASRTMTLKSGGDLVEGLDEVDEAKMQITYRLSKENIEAFPVGSYTASMKVMADGEGSKIEWSSRLYRADTTNEPPENRNDAAALKAMSDFFKQGLEGLKAKLEAKG